MRSVLRTGRASACTLKTHDANAGSGRSRCKRVRLCATFVPMENAIHRFADLFSQLGLASSPAAVQAFINGHAPLQAHVRLEDAPFWTDAQSLLLHELIAEDADWAALVDQLNSALH